MAAQGGFDDLDFFRQDKLFAIFDQRNDTIHAFFDVIAGRDLLQCVWLNGLGEEVTRFASFGDPLMLVKDLAFTVGV
jgi:hypothetical protein